uniref:Uncharacterized protein n=1 Tax=Tanacetum cinerariifolium TaxID=118510 RepID=A0A6L2K8M1_TANCI|nr:hypothetical protein [Tanacetum cinerariifolium]
MEIMLEPTSNKLLVGTVGTYEPEVHCRCCSLVPVSNKRLIWLCHSSHVVKDKKLAISNASSMLEDFDPPFYEPLFFKEVPSIPRNLKTHAEGFCPTSLHFLSFNGKSCIQI